MRNPRGFSLTARSPPSESIAQGETPVRHRAQQRAFRGPPSDLSSLNRTFVGRFRVYALDSALKAPPSRSECTAQNISSTMSSPYPSRARMLENCILNLVNEISFDKIHLPNALTMRPRKV